MIFVGMMRGWVILGVCWQMLGYFGGRWCHLVNASLYCMNYINFDAIVRNAEVVLNYANSSANAQPRAQK